MHDGTSYRIEFELFTRIPGEGEHSLSVVEDGEGGYELHIDEDMLLCTFHSGLKQFQFIRHALERELKSVLDQIEAKIATDPSMQIDPYLVEEE
jgi:hypothetical protein